MTPNRSGGQTPESGESEEIDAATAALNRARRSSRGQSAPIPRRNVNRSAANQRGVPTQRDASGPGPRDPQGLGKVLKRVVAERGWQSPVAVGSVIADWQNLIGASNAAHCRPESFEGTVLQVRCDSTAWATQLRLMSPALLAKFASELGDGVVTKIQVLGPVSPNWQRGRRQVRGRGPRDTYG